MNISVVLLALLTITVSASTSSFKEANGSKGGKVPHFSFWERHLFQMLSKQNPKLFKGHTFDEILGNLTAPSPQADYPEHIYIDDFFVEYRQLLTQAIKIQKDVELPEFDWSEYYDFCVWIICFQFTANITSSGSSLIGAQGTTTKTEITPETIKNVFTVPHLEFRSPNWLFTADFEGYFIGMQGYHIYVDNFTIETNARYQFEEGVGILLTSLDIDLRVDNYKTVLDYNWLIIDGELEEGKGWESDLTWDTMNNWDRAKEAYTSNLLRHFNCLLTQKRAFPAKCEPSAEVKYDEYYQFLLTQLIQTTGLGALL